MDMKTTPKGAEGRKMDKILKGFLTTQASDATWMLTLSVEPGRQGCFLILKAHDALWLYKRAKDI